ncbi:hypothetical protein BH23ACT3_BH23ACT3_18670 [soil metagenome]
MSTEPPDEVPITSVQTEPDGTIDTQPVVDEREVGAADDGGLSAWSALPPDPAGPRVSPQVVWTGAEAIAVYGTDQRGNLRTDVSSYIPATGLWRELADPPLDGPMASQHVDPLVAWTGEEMLLVGGRAGREPARDVAFGAFAYEPHRDMWRTITAPTWPVGASHSWVWTGHELLVLTFRGPIAYDPASDAWRDLAESPVSERTQAASVWTGEEWIVWGGSHDGRDLADGAAYDPATDTWRTIAVSPLSARRAPAVWTGSEMIVASGAAGDEGAPQALADGAAYHPATDSWRPIADGFGHPGFLPVWTGTHLVMFAKGAAVVYDPAADVWVDQCCNDTGGGPGGTPVWTGTSIVLIGSHSADAGGSVFTIRAGGVHDRTIPIEIEIDAARSEVSSIDAIMARIPDDSFEVPFNSARLTDPDAVPDHSPNLVYVNTWTAASCGCVMGIAVVEDFGDDAPLYGYLADTERIPSDLGDWMLMVGEHPDEPIVAMLRIDGLLIQVSTTRATTDLLGVIIDTIEIQRG